jgi:Caspase domain
MRRVSILLLAVLQVCLFAVCAKAEQRVALVFGNSDYRNAPRLPNPVNDATDVAAAFERLGFSVSLIRNGSFDTMRRGLLDFAQRTQGADIAILYFAGHGMEIRDENWLIPTDAELRLDVSAGQEAISLGSVMPIVSKARKLGLVILDACRENPFSRQMQASQPGRTLVSRGLIPIEPPNSVLVAFAAKHGTTADDGSGRNSPFTTALLRNLETPGLEVGYLFRNVHDEVYSATQHRQEPYVYGTLSKEPIYLKAANDPSPRAATQSANPVEQDAKTILPTNSASEAERVWALTKDATSRAVLQAFVKRFGDTAYGELATARLKELEQSEQKPQDKVALLGAPQSQPAEAKVFENPTINGVRVDRCMRWGPEGCNAPAANYWCRSKGFSHATSWSSKIAQPTIFQDQKSSVRICDFPFCGGFTRITCE